MRLPMCIFSFNILLSVSRHLIVVMISTSIEIILKNSSQGSLVELNGRTVMLKWSIVSNSLAESCLIKLLSKASFAITPNQARLSITARSRCSTPFQLKALPVGAPPPFAQFWVVVVSHPRTVASAKMSPDTKTNHTGRRLRLADLRRRLLIALEDEGASHPARETHSRLLSVAEPRQPLGLLCSILARSRFKNVETSTARENSLGQTATRVPKDHQSCVLPLLRLTDTAAAIISNTKHIFFISLFSI